MKATLLRKIKEINDLLLLLSSSLCVSFGVPAKKCSPVNRTYEIPLILLKRNDICPRNPCFYNIGALDMAIRAPGIQC